MNQAPVNLGAVTASEAEACLMPRGAKQVNVKIADLSLEKKSPADYS